MSETENKTTWDIDELLAFVKRASELAGGHEIKYVEAKIFRINPKRKKDLLHYDNRVPILSAKCRGSHLYVRLPSPRNYVAKSPLGKLAMAAESRLHMPEADRRELLLTMVDAMRRCYDVIENTGRRYHSSVDEIPPLTTKATGVRGTPKKTIDDWETRAREVYYARRAAERRLEKLEARVARLRAREDKLDAHVEKLKAREAERKQRRADAELKKLNGS